MLSFAAGQGHPEARDLLSKQGAMVRQISLNLDDVRK